MDTNSEEWRHETECRYIAKLPNSNRVEWMSILAEKRGKEAAEKIEKRVLEILTSGSTKDLL